MKTEDMKCAVVVSEFNQEITDKLLEGAHVRLLERGLCEKNIKVIKVPGAVEVPLTAKMLAKSGKYDAIICLSAVIRGETSHYDYVCQQISQGCQQVMLAFDVPVIFGVLTTENIEQAEDRIGGKEGHKGIEAADAAIRMIEVMKLEVI
ncbi:MAG TPA: 6,7-dimethyl-8-ribityllumazine synthase [Gammaproteobacteria bacterium]|nr:6,7-dimethyl-8-ribityllumazine synthase [Gammaproteobacteria bacterium]